MNQQFFIRICIALVPAPALALGICLPVQAQAQVRALEETLTKPVRSDSGDISEYAITFVLRDKRERPIWTNDQITLGTGQVVCGHTNLEGLTQQVSSAAVQTTAILALPLEPCLPQPPSDEKAGQVDIEKPNLTSAVNMPMGADAEPPR